MNLFTTVLLPVFVCSFFVFLLLELHTTNPVKSILETAKLAAFVTLGVYGIHLFIGSA